MTTIQNWPAIAASQPEVSFPDLVQQHLSPAQQEALIEAILCEEEDTLEAWRARLIQGIPKVNALLYSSAEIAFNALVYLPAVFFNQHSEFLFRRFESAFIQADRDESAKKVLTKLMALVSQTKAGLSAANIADLMHRLPFLNVIDKLELYLLMAKVELEGREYQDTAEQKKALRDWCLNRLEIDSRPYLQIVHLYVWRQFNPREALQGLQFHEIALQREIQTHHELQPYLVLNLRQAIFSLLLELDQQSLWDFAAIHKEFQTNWMRTLIDDCMLHPAMKNIRENYQQAIAFSQAEHQDQFEQLEKRFDL